MGTVFLAEHWLIKRKVAIKILHAELAEDATMIRRFMNEALAAGTLGHPNIVESTDMGFTKTDMPYIVFEYLEGTSLADEIDRLGGLPLARARSHRVPDRIGARSRARGRHHSSRSQVRQHLPRRQKRDSADHVKVLDFGISRFLAASDRTGRWQRCSARPSSWRPSRSSRPSTIDHRADIYALGVVLYEMLTGHVPFVLAAGREVPLDMDTAHALLDADPPRPPAAASSAATRRRARRDGHRQAAREGRRASATSR